jgi:hypothetical protein
MSIKDIKGVFSLNKTSNSLLNCKIKKTIDRVLLKERINSDIIRGLNTMITCVKKMVVINDKICIYRTVVDLTLFHHKRIIEARTRNNDHHHKGLAYFLIVTIKKIISLLRANNVCLESKYDILIDVLCISGFHTFMSMRVVMFPLVKQSQFNKWVCQWNNLSQEEKNNWEKKN